MDTHYFLTNLRDVYQQAFPIAIVHNSRDHFVPTATISPNAYNSWKLTALCGMLKNCETMIEEVDTNLLTAQQKNVVRALQTDIQHYSDVFTAETSGAEIANTMAVTTGRHPQGPLVPLPGPLPSGQSLLPSSASTKKGKKHMCEH